MKLLKIPLKNIALNKKRSFALFLFMLVSAFLLLVLLNLILTINSNMMHAMTDSISGNVEVRPSGTKEKEMVSFTESWVDLKLFNEESEKIEKSLDGLDYEPRLRGEGTLVHSSDMVSAKYIGVCNDNYQKAVKLCEGDYLDADVENGILLTKTMAGQIDVEAGDTVKLLYDKDDKKETVELKVQGIIEMSMLGMFGVDVAYMNQSYAQELFDLDENTYTEYVVYTDKSTEDLQSEVERRLKKSDMGSDVVNVTNWRKMGNTILGGIQLYEIMFVVFLIAYLIIIAILVINLITMMGTERMADIGTLKAIGYSRSQIVYLFVAEIGIITLVGDLVGSILGVIVSNILSKSKIDVAAPMNLVLGDKFSLEFSPVTILPIYLFIFVFGCLVAMLPSLKISKQNAVDTLKDM